jgi:hypothetical protein
MSEAQAMAALAEPPSMTEDEFKLACQSLVQKCEAAGLEQCGWLEISFSVGQGRNGTSIAGGMNLLI